MKVSAGVREPAPAELMMVITLRCWEISGRKGKGEGQEGGGMDKGQERM